MVPMSWREKLLDTIIDRNVLFALMFIPVIVFAIPEQYKAEAFAILAGLAFTGGVAKTVMNGIKGKALIESSGPATASSTTTTTTESRGGGNGQEA